MTHDRNRDDRAATFDRHVGADPTRLVGLHLRYALTDVLSRGGVWTPTTLASELAAAGFVLGARSTKIVSDALRSEVGRGRVRRVDRGRYVAQPMPDSTRRRLRRTTAERRRRITERIGARGPTVPAMTAPSPTPAAEPITPERAAAARKAWRTLEPYHGFIYFAPEATEEYAAIGLDGMSGYFASRAAAMGDVTAATVEATFFNFHPDLVQRAMAAIPPQATAEAVLAARLRAVDRGLRARLDPAADGPAATPDATTPILDPTAPVTDGPAMARAADLAVRAAVSVGTTGVPTGGRPLALAHARTPLPEAAHLRLWWAITVLREYRGDGHIAMLVDAGLDGIEALVLHGASGAVDDEILRSTRAWSRDEWSAAVDRLASRRLLTTDGAITEEGQAFRDAIDDRTDHLAAPAWAALDPAEMDELRDLVRPWSKAIQARMFA